MRLEAVSEAGLDSDTDWSAEETAAGAGATSRTNIEASAVCKESLAAMTAIRGSRPS